MGSRNPDRIRRLGDMRLASNGHLHMLHCRRCSHLMPLPLAELVAKHGRDYPVEAAMILLECSECGTSTPEPKWVKLCEPGCRQNQVVCGPG